MEGDLDQDEDLLAASGEIWRDESSSTRVRGSGGVSI
jgi:hypothetical protein